jgi:GntP family gluconate:H+ symporter
MFLIKEKTIESMNSVFGEAIEKAGPILIVTAAGGMFGMVIKATGTGESIGRILAGTNIGIVVPFLIAVIMKTAQGSSTVAIITTASFVAPMLSLLGLDSEWGRLLTMLSMGAGSMIVSHANDSYFWVISNFSEIDPAVTLKVYSSSTHRYGVSCICLRVDHFSNSFIRPMIHETIVLLLIYLEAHDELQNSCRRDLSGRS